MTVAQLLSRLEGGLAVLLNIVGGKVGVEGDQVGVEAVDDRTEGQPVPPARREVCHLYYKIFAVYFLSGLWILIRMDPDPGGKNLRKKQKKCKEIGRNCNFILTN